MHRLCNPALLPLHAFFLSFGASAEFNIVLPVWRGVTNFGFRHFGARVEVSMRQSHGDVSCQSCPDLLAIATGHMWLLST